MKTFGKIMIILLVAICTSVVLTPIGGLIVAVLMSIDMFGKKPEQPFAVPVRFVGDDIPAPEPARRGSSFTGA